MTQPTSHPSVQLLTSKLTKMHRLKNSRIKVQVRLIKNATIIHVFTLLALELPLPRGRVSSTNCFFGCQPPTELRHLSHRQCAEIFVQRKVVAKYGSRVCRSHFDDGIFNIPQMVPIAEEATTVDANDMVKMLKAMSKLLTEERERQQHQIDFLTMSDSAILFETGLNRERFNHLRTMIMAENPTFTNSNNALGNLR